MAKTKRKTSRPTASYADGLFALKLAMYLILGSIWIKVSNAGGGIPLPVGLAVGLIFTAHERFAIDRKFEYAVLLIAAFIGYWVPMGLYVHF